MLVKESDDYEFADPIPPSRRHVGDASITKYKTEMSLKVKLSDLSSVDINWKMLTIARPDTKVEEVFYTK